MGAYQEHEKVLDLDRTAKTPASSSQRTATSSRRSRCRAARCVRRRLGGGKRKGLQMVEAPRRPRRQPTDARFALLLLYKPRTAVRRRAEAARDVARSISRNRLMGLESGATSCAPDGAADADRFLTGGLARLQTDARPRMFGEDALWWYKRGATRAALATPTRSRLEKALTVDGRSGCRAGRISSRHAGAESRHARPAAEHFREAARLCESDNDQVSADEARGFLR